MLKSLTAQYIKIYTIRVWLKNSRQEREEWLATSIANVLTNLEKEAILNAIQLLNKTVDSE